MMRFIAIVAALLVATSAAHAQTNKVCPPIVVNGTKVNLASIPAPATFYGMTNARVAGGSATVSVNLCATSTAVCGASYVTIQNASGATCFTAALSRPAPRGDGVQMKYSGKNGDDATVVIKCSPGASNSLETKTHKFATRAGKNGGTSFMFVFTSGAVCAAPPPSPSNGSSCKTVMVKGKSVDPSSWKAVFLSLMRAPSYQFQDSFLFSLCSATPQPPSYLPKCSSLGYITNYNSNTCAGGAFTSMTNFQFTNGQIRTSYSNGSHTFNIAVGCAYGSPSITSLSGSYSCTGTTCSAVLGIQDLCSGATPPPWTPPPRPASDSNSNSFPDSHSGSNPSSGSMPGPMPSSGSGNQPTGSGSGVSPSGGSGSMPSGGSMPSSGSQPYPSSGGGSEPSGGSMPSEYVK